MIDTEKMSKGVEDICKGFVEVTEATTGVKVCLPLNKILSISSCKDGTCFFETGVDNKGNSTGVFTKEYYSDIILRLLKVIL